MNNQRLSVLLIVLMVITPVASAFGHCTAMVEAGHFSESQISTISDDVALHHQNTDQHNHQMQSDRCHTTGSGCTLHVCGGYAMTSSTSTFDITAVNRFVIVLHASFENTILSPDIKPPIAIL